MHESIKLSELQAAAMRVLWERGEASAADVHEALAPTRGLAFTTIATTLKRLEKRGLLDHRLEDRRYIYRPLVSEEEARSSMAGHMVDVMFGGETAALVNHLLDQSEIGEDDLAAIKNMIEKAKRKAKGESR